MQKPSTSQLLVIIFILGSLTSSCGTPPPESQPDATVAYLETQVFDYLNPTSTSTPAPTHTDAPTPTSTSTPLPEGYQIYHIELELQSASPRVWMPAPRYWDGQGILSIKYLEISPDPSNWFREENGTEILYWENRTGRAQVYRLVFNIELIFIDNSIASRLDFPPYDETSYIYQKYTQPQNEIQSDAQEIIDLAATIIGGETNPYMQAKRIHSWMTRNIGGGSVPRDALSTLHNQGNDCAGKAHLFVALLRAARIPARNVSGIHSPGNQYLQSGNWWPDRSMGYHVWSEFYLPDYGWFQVDPGNPSMFEIIREHRIVTSKGNDIRIGSGFPRSQISWFHLPYNLYQQIEDEPLIFSVTQIP